MTKRIFIGCLLTLCFTTLSANDISLRSEEICDTVVGNCDNGPPEPVDINALSVDPQTNQTQIFWTPSPSYFTYGYIIYKGALATPFDIVGAEINSYTVPGQADTSLRLYIAAVDSCCNTQRRSGARQVFACKVEQRACERKINISWSDAQRSVSNIIRYDIMLSKNDSAYTLVTTVDSLQRSAAIDASGHLQKYKIYVRAVSSDTTIYANSISDSVIVIVAPEPEFAYIETLNVIDDKTVEMRCHVHVSIVWKELFAYVDGSLEKTITYADFLENNHLLLPRKNAFYHFELSDTCGDIVSRSNDAKPILLQAELQENTVEMTISAYQGWENTYIRYDVFEIKDNDTTLVVSFFQNSDFTHQVPVQNPEQISRLSYYVVAHEGDGNPYGIRATAKSNVVTVILKGEVPVHFPTGFVPGGVTPTYRPIYLSLPGDVMQFQIHNKFGQIVFSTDNPDEGWDGTFRGQAQPGAVYMYQFIITRNGHTTQKKGWFVIVR
ncbi:MAG: gliding motility-associated C-terminal domain-containing protein [Bacteroidales bacterium]|jgi:gliding motility-associated-like protein|nr:gliding motility-associated C-terminal domain-containing protein [Bacteroidales bacterium]